MLSECVLTVHGAQLHKHIFILICTLTVFHPTLLSPPLSPLLPDSSFPAALLSYIHTYEATENIQTTNERRCEICVSETDLIFFLSFFEGEGGFLR